MDVIAAYLNAEGYTVHTAENGKEVLDILRTQPMDLLILDRMMPILSGVEALAEIRSKSDVPVILLTARSAEMDRVQGLDFGADDYVVKPFSPRELMARVRAHLRRTSGSHSNHIQHGDLVLEEDSYRCRLHGEDLDLTPKEFMLLLHLAKNPDRVFSRAELLDLVFGEDYDGYDRTIDVHIKNLRKKLGDMGGHIETVYGAGYRLKKKV